jgi:hypothetical protein
VQAVHARRGQGKKRHTARDIDVLAAHVQPLDVWYLLTDCGDGAGSEFEILSGY